jgi:hypothetical protein
LQTKSRIGLAKLIRVKSLMSGDLINDFAVPLFGDFVAQKYLLWTIFGILCH